MKDLITFVDTSEPLQKKWGSRMTKWMREAGIKKPIRLELIDDDKVDDEALGRYIIATKLIRVSLRHRADLVKFTLFHEIGHRYQANLNLVLPFFGLDPLERDANKRALAWGAYPTDKGVIKYLREQGVLGYD